MWGECIWSAHFYRAKKYGRVRVVSNMRDLHKIVKPSKYTLPNITDTLRKHYGYTYFTNIDISMQYYTFELMEKANNMCVITTLFRNNTNVHIWAIKIVLLFS